MRSLTRGPSPILTLRLPVAVKREVARLARESKTSQSDLYRYAITQWLWRNLPEDRRRRLIAKLKRREPTSP